MIWNFISDYHNKILIGTLEKIFLSANEKVCSSKKLKKHDFSLFFWNNDMILWFKKKSMVVAKFFTALS